MKTSNTSRPGIIFGWRSDEAQTKVAEILAKKPDFSTQAYVKKSAVYQIYADLLLEGLTLAGFPE